MTAVSCPTASWCVVGAKDGTVVTWSGGARGEPTKVFKGAGGSVDGVLCPTTSFCMAVTDVDGGVAFPLARHRPHSRLLAAMDVERFSQTCQLGHSVAEIVRDMAEVVETGLLYRQTATVRSFVITDPS